MERGRLYRIAEDLDGHVWYLDLEAEIVGGVEAFLGRWAAFEEAVTGLSSRDDDSR